MKLSLKQGVSIGIVGVVIFGIGLIYFGEGAPPLSTPSSERMPSETGTPLPESSTMQVPEGWLPYQQTEMGLSFRYDPTFTVSADTADLVRLYKWGPTQKGQTEMYDGMLVTFHQVTYSGDFESYVKQRMQALQTSETVMPVAQPYSFRGVPAQRYDGSASDGTTYIFVPRGLGSVLEISTLVLDPGKLGFQGVVDSILQTVQFDGRE
jgi:hypothetical protein